MMRPGKLLCALAIVTLLAAPLMAQAGAGQVSEEQTRESLRKVTVLFIITLLVLIIMFGDRDPI